MNPVTQLELYLVRHGQSLMNVENGYGVEGAALTLAQREDPQLSAEGLRQAELLGEKLAGTHFDAVISSPLIRAAQTAAEIVKHTVTGVKKITVLPLLTECGTSLQYSGMSISELNEKFGNYFVPVQGTDCESPLVFGNDGNDESAQRKRAENVLSFLHDSYQNGERVILSGHGEFNTELLLCALNIGTDRAFDPYFANTGVTKLVFYKAGTGPFGYDIRLCCVNSIAHLNKNGQEAYS